MIAKLPRVQHTSLHGSLLQLAEDHRIELIHALKNMGSTEMVKLYMMHLQMNEKDHFRVLNESVNSHKRRKDDV